jgi:hypothetical protein
MQHSKKRKLDKILTTACSLDLNKTQYGTPKIGIIFHWGLYSVPGFLKKAERKEMEVSGI